MKITIVTMGTRGDVQPYLALAKGLMQRGHDVLLSAPVNFDGWIAEHGVAQHPIPVNLHAFLQSPDVRRVVSGKWWALRGIWRKTVVPMMAATLDAVAAASRTADVIVFHPKVIGAGDVAEATGATPVLAAPVPMLPTAEFPFIVSARSYGRWLNRQTWRLFNYSRFPYLALLNRWRRETLGLGPGPRIEPLGTYVGGRMLRLCAVSAAVVPRPADWADGDHMTGYWFLDEDRDWTPDPALADFLAAGEAPVYVGFGSMTAEDPERLAQEVAAGVAAAGVRAVLATGWGAMETIAAADHVHVIGAAPHANLFPLMRAVVHHGGAGSVAAGLRSGRPTLVCPQAVDQPFWGRRVHDLGCGPRPLPLKKLRAAVFADRLRDLVGNPAYATAAAAVAVRIAGEDGVAQAVHLIETCRSRHSDRV